MPENDQQRADRAVTLARAQGRREAEVDGRLDAHEKRLNAINGSIDRAAKRSEETTHGLSQLSEKVDALIAQQHTREAVADALRQEVKRANEKQIGKIGFYISTAAVVVTLLGVIFSVLIGVHAI
jgi:sugar-specific transcriptional regulator TrmB